MTNYNYKFVAKHLDLFLNKQKNLKVKKKKEKKDTCSICLEVVNNKTRLLCKHQFCFKCINTWKDTKRTCPLCRANFNKYINDNIIYKLPPVNQGNENNNINNELTYYEPEELCSECNLPGRLLICDNCNGVLGYSVHVLCAGYENIFFLLR